MAGYAEVLGTAGLRWPVIGDRLSLGVRASLGLGGGGDIDTGGGLLVKAAAGATLRLTDTLGIGAEVGVRRRAARPPLQGRHRRRVAQLVAGRAAERPGRAGPTPAPARPRAWNSAPAVERYRAARKDGHTEALEAVVLQINRFVSPNLYVTGQAHSAFAGGAGAYSVGLFGVGAQLPVAARLRLGAEALARRGRRRRRRHPGRRRACRRAPMWTSR